MLQRCYKLRSSRLTEIFWECGLFVNPGTYAFSRGNEVICWTATLNNRSLGGREPNRTSSSHFDSHKTQCCVRPISSYLSNVQLSNSQQSRSVCRVGYMKYLEGMLHILLITCLFNTNKRKLPENIGLGYVAKVVLLFATAAANATIQWKRHRLRCPTNNVIN